MNFFIFDEYNDSFVLDNNILIFKSKNQNCASLFSKVDIYSEAAVQRPSKMKAAMYDIFSILSETMRSKNLRNEKFAIIAKGINYLEHDEAQLLSIKEIAEMCNVSEIYFRQLFKKYSGVPPIKYRINSKIEKAKLCIRYENMTAQEISEYLGFISPAYFTRQFKAYTGLTPSEYKKHIEASN